MSLMKALVIINMYVSDLYRWHKTNLVCMPEILTYSSYKLGIIARNEQAFNWSLFNFLACSQLSCRVLAAVRMNYGESTAFQTPYHRIAQNYH